jgi:hypothetical protein
MALAHAREIDAILVTELWAQHPHRFYAARNLAISAFADLTK